MNTTQERLSTAGDRLEGAAERLHETIDDIIEDPQKFEIARERITEGIKEVRRQVDEIERIVR